jgi:hypothetical protein
VAWSDNGAGGQFGKIGQDGAFHKYPEECSAPEVSRYKTPTDPQVVSLQVTMDDQPWDWEPGSGQLVQTADDPQQVSPPTKITVWDFTIEGPDAGWRPRGEPIRIRPR